MARQLENITIENARIAFRNFAGVAGKFNKEGERSFSVMLAPDLATAMIADGWNVKQLKPRDDGDAPQDYLSVKVSYKNRPPRIVMITSKGRTSLGEDSIGILDWAEIKKVDLIINPFAYDFNGNSGVSAYLKSIFVTIVEDELDLKYADVPESAQNTLGDDSGE